MKGKREELQSKKKEKNTQPSGPIGDPFLEETVKPTMGERWRFYWDSGRGKILATVLGCLAIFAIVVAVVLKSWVKPPQPPSAAQTPAPVQAAVSRHRDEEPAEPTDDDLYPDDGYNGDMPTVSGNRKDGWYTFLLVGTDMDDGNTDTLMVVSYDTEGQKINIMSIPRDTMINESWDIKKINSVYSRTGNSLESLESRIQKLVGFKPDFYVKVELSMFVELVDLVGGVEFDVPQDMNYDDPWQNLHIHLNKGVQTLDGEHAMELVRFRRYSEGDIKRVEVQQNFMKALIKECLSIKHWGKIKAYIDLAMKNIQTDLDSGSIVWFAANVLGLNGVGTLTMEDVETCTLPGDYWGSAWSRDTQQQQSYVTIYPGHVVKLVNEKFNPYEQNVTAGMLDAMSILKNGDIASSTGNLRDTRHNAIMAVQRGEAYYDADGHLVYGKPPERPEQDEDGNYYMEDEDGNIVYTDADGNPVDSDPMLPPAGGLGQPVSLPGTPVDGNQAPGTTASETTDSGITLPGATDSGITLPGATDSGITLPDAAGPETAAEPVVEPEPDVPAAVDAGGGQADAVDEGPQLPPEIGESGLPDGI